MKQNYVCLFRNGSFEIVLIQGNNKGITSFFYSSKCVCILLKRLFSKHPHHSISIFFLHFFFHHLFYPFLFYIKESNLFDLQG